MWLAGWLLDAGEVGGVDDAAADHRDGDLDGAILGEIGTRPFFASTQRGRVFGVHQMPRRTLVGDVAADCRPFELDQDVVVAFDDNLLNGTDVDVATLFHLHEPSDERTVLGEPEHVGRGSVHGSPIERVVATSAHGMCAYILYHKNTK